MSRIRSVHPGLWTDEQFVSLSPFARLLFIGIWNECDDKGIFQWSALQMKMRILPADNVDAAALLDELKAAGCVRNYVVSGKTFGAVRNFVKFQRPKSPNDIHPAPPEILAFSGHCVDQVPVIAETLPNDFPNASEICPQMEDGGEEIKEELEPNGSCASGDAPLRPDEVAEAWNEMAKAIGKPALRAFTPERRQLTKARIAQHPLDDFVTVFANIRASPFLRDWRGCGFDWVMKKGNFQKILEGNYNG